MSYDHQLTIYALTGSSRSGTLTPTGTHLYAEREVYHARYWESVQAGTSVDRMVTVPGHIDVTCTQYAIPEDGHAYKILQAQFTEDEDRLPATAISLHRAEGNYDVLEVTNDS